VQTNIQKFLRERKKEIHRQLKHVAANPEGLSSWSLVSERLEVQGWRGRFCWLPPMGW